MSFEKLKGKDKKAAQEGLGYIAGETTRQGFALVPKALANAWAKAEPTLLTVKEGDADPLGNVQVFATSLGMNAAGAPAPAAPAVEKASQFTLEEGLQMPEAKRGGKLKGSIYPFSSMKVGQSFFVPATDDNPSPAKGMASTVSSANKRYASVYPATTGKDKTPHPQAGQSTGQDGRTFAVRAVEAKDGKPAGARVWRTA